MNRQWTGYFAPAMLALEAQQVIALRMAKFAMGGPAAMGEASRMVSEKMDATVSAAGMVACAMASGASNGGADKVVRMLRKRVRANRKRLLG